jgi:acetolactate decarboxylase
MAEDHVGSVVGGVSEKDDFAMRMRMRNVPRLRLAVLGVLGAMLLAGCAGPPVVHQVSTLQALMQGAYEGQVPCRELTRHGTLGIGTFDRLDGELILLDGQVFQARADGAVVRNPATTTPFANVVRFEPQAAVRPVEAPVDLEGLLAVLEERTGSKNLLYAVRIEGQFAEMKVRSVPRQERPYPPLAEAAKGQHVFELQNESGTVVGFRFPDYIRGVNMPGWHLHFISADRRRGGHVLGLCGSQLRVRVQTIRRFEMDLPERGTFVTADLGKDMSREIHEVEKAR